MLEVKEMIRNRSIIRDNNNNKENRISKGKTFFLFIYILMRLTRRDLGNVFLIIYIRRFFFHSHVYYYYYKRKMCSSKKEKSERVRNNN